MAQIDFKDIFGLQTDRGQDSKMSLALLLQAIAQMLSAGGTDPSMKDEREQRETEIRVRPRIEPLGGA